MTWLDERIGRVLNALHSIGAAEDTIIVVSSDHGDFLGERGLWYKMSFLDPSARIPLIVHAPKLFAPRRIHENTSLLDLFPTFLEWAGDGQIPELFAPIDGTGMNGLLAGNTRDWPDTALSEYCGEGTDYPMLMVRRGRWKYVFSEGDSPLLYDLDADPDELHNLAGEPATRALEAQLSAEVHRQWDPPALKDDVLRSHRLRLFLHRALGTGTRTSWDWQPIRDATRQYLRTEADMGDTYSPKRS